MRSGPDVSPPAAVRARGWGWRHAGRRAWALLDLDLAVEPGERVLLLGPSGAGKSTLLAALAGVLGGDDDGDSSGILTVDGRDPRAARGSVGLVLQDPDSQVIMSRVGDDVAFGCENLGVPRDELWARVREALELVGLDVPLDHPTEALSGGQKQRLALAGALAMRPGLLLLDEPTANIDPDGVLEVRDAVGAVLARTGATAIIVEHRVEAWLDVVDRVVVLGSDGTLMADGEPRAVLAAHGDALAAAGVWVPGREPRIARRDGPAERPALLTAEGLSLARVPGSPLAATVSSPLEVRVAAGEVLALTGPNGSGKTTLALTLGGLLAPFAGEVRAEPPLAAGADPHPIRMRSRELLTRIGTVFQTPEHQFLTSTAREELALGPRTLRLDPAVVDQRVDELLDRLGLDALADANPFTLSGGQKRRLSVGAVLATRPRVLVLDEPTFGQDAVTWAALVELLEELRSVGSAVVAATHDPRFVAALGADELALSAVLA
ncbi:MAG TPA: ABC transporter ATP-binding protein [Pseudolysinimonas sp.]|jgi:energy-coupling factor transport system ATP-binding protein